MIRFHAEGVREGPILGAPGALQAKPEELMDELKAGRLRSLRFSAQVFMSGPNRNHFRIPDQEMEAFASSFAGLPFLKDHDEQLSSVGGRILSSELVTLEDGRRAIRQQILATKPWAIENVLDGTVSRFSIGWFAKKQVCTACKTDFLSKGCRHMPWDIGTADAESGETVELETQGCEGRETSAVVTPAVPGTGIEGLLLQAKEEVLKTSGKEYPVIPTEASGVKSGEAAMLQKVSAALGLAENATEPEVLAEVERLKGSASVPAPLLTALGLKADASADDAVASVVRMTAPDAFVTRDVHDALVEKHRKLEAAVNVDALVVAGRITPANKAWALKTAIENPAGFEAIYGKDKNPPRVTALGTPAPNVISEDPASTTPEPSDIAIRLGVTPAEYAAQLAEERKQRMEGR